MKLSIIVPTCGRRSLQHTLRSIRVQELLPGDEVLLVTDGPEPLAVECFHRTGLPGQVLETTATHDWGGTQRNAGMNQALGDYLLFMDDDDAYLPGALRMVRAALAANPQRFHLFRMRYASDGRLLWTDRRVVLGNVSTQMLVVPRRPDLRPWDSRHGHDHRFVCDNLALWPADGLIWRDEVIAVIRPHESQEHAPQPCPFQQPLRDSPERVACRLVQQISGVLDESLCRVGADLCAACLTSFAPSPIGPNPVVASVLYALAETVIERGGVPGCPPAAAAQLQSWAESRLLFDLTDSTP